MSQQTLNLGILAHVDAGKTTLTEQLLYAAGVIDAVGSVDKGTTQTDSLDLERQRGITIRSAVVSFAIGGVKVNLIDTPGHPDFIAEVERVLGVLDGAVLVISAVEGVQSQTLVLMRALQRLGVATLVFVNKIDRAGADPDRVLRAIAERLSPAAVALGSVRAPGTRAAAFTPSTANDAAFRGRLAETLAEHDEQILAAYVEDETALSYGTLQRSLTAQTAKAVVHPVFFGSAMTGAGVEPLMAGIAKLLPASTGDPGGVAAGRIFKIERGGGGGKVAYVRMFSGTVRTRDRVRCGHELEEKVTAIDVFENGSAVPGPCVRAGEIATLRGLGEIRIGDPIGEPRGAAVERQFAPPTLEAAVVPGDPADGARLRVALAQLAEQDPLINVRRDAGGGISVSLYGEVQKEVIEATLVRDYGIGVRFSDATTIYVERPAGTGEAVEILNAESNPFLATIGLRVEPAPRGSREFRLDVDPRTVPLYLYKTLDGFAERIGDAVRGSLREGLRGWQVVDYLVTMTRCVYSVPDGPPSRRGPLSTPGDFRKLVPLVLMQSLERAGTVVCEPVVRVGLEIPARAVGSVLPVVAQHATRIETPLLGPSVATIETVLPAARVHDLQRELTALTGGEGALHTEFAGYEPVSGVPPVRERTTPSPLNRKEYLVHLSRRVSGR